MLDVALCVLCVAVCAAMCCTRGHTPHVQAKKQKVTYSEAFSFFFFFLLASRGHPLMVARVRRQESRQPRSHKVDGSSPPKVFVMSVMRRFSSELGILTKPHTYFPATHSPSTS
jgi:hypothetical protein